MSNLWPTNIDDTGKSLPISPVVEQAELLAKQTANIIKAEVCPVMHENRSIFSFDFDLVVSVLDYHFTLFRLYYSVAGYPVFFIPYAKISAELELQPMTTVFGIKRAIKSEDMGSVIDALGRILRSNTTRSVLQTLFGQAKKFGAHGEQPNKRE